MTQFKIGDYAIHEKIGVVLHVTNYRDKQIMNSQHDYRKATEDEIRKYHEEDETQWGKLI